MKYKNKLLMIPLEQRKPAWIRTTYHTILKRISYQRNEPITYYIDEALGEWLRKNNHK